MAPSNDSTSTLTKKLLEQNALNCKSCYKLLKTPVYLAEGKPICVNCADLSDSSLQRVKIYDLFLNDLIIPCTLQGCDVQVPYADYQEHLEDCKFRRVHCISVSCNWTGPLASLPKHFRKQHDDDVVTSEMFVFSLDTRQDKVVNKLLVRNNKMYFFVIRLDNHEIKYNLFQVDKGDSHAVIRHFYNKNDIRLEISAESINVLDKEPRVNKIALANLELILENNRILSIKVDLPSNNKSEVLLQYLECPICQETMKPPIYQCGVGHSICANCASKLTTCPTCKSTISKEIRNYSLEALASSTTYSCAYKAFGCDELVSGSTIKEHESKCSYMSYECPLPECVFRGRFSSFKSHVLNEHPDILHCHKCQCKVANVFQIDHTVKICHDGAIYLVHFYSLISIMAKTFFCEVKVLGQDFGKCKISVENPANGSGISYVVTQAGKVQFVESTIVDILKSNTNLNFCFEVISNSSSTQSI